MAGEILNHLDDNDSHVEQNAGTLNVTEKNALRESVKANTETLANSLLNKKFSIVDSSGAKTDQDLYSILKGIKNAYYPGSGTEIQKIASGNVEFSIGDKNYSIGWNSELAGVIQSFLVAAGHGKSNTKLNQSTFIDGRIGTGTIGAIKDFVVAKEIKDIRQKIDTKQNSSEIPKGTILPPLFEGFKNTIDSNQIFFNETTINNATTRLAPSNLGDTINLAKQKIAKKFGILKPDGTLKYKLDEKTNEIKFNIVSSDLNKTYTIPLKDVVAVVNDEVKISKSLYKEKIESKISKEIFVDYSKAIVAKGTKNVDMILKNSDDVETKINSLENLKTDTNKKVLVNNISELAEFNKLIDNEINGLNQKKELIPLINYMKNCNIDKKSLFLENSMTKYNANQFKILNGFTNDMIKVTDIKIDRSFKYNPSKMVVKFVLENNEGNIDAEIDSKVIKNNAVDVAEFNKKIKNIIQLALDRRDTPIVQKKEKIV